MVSTDAIERKRIMIKYSGFGGRECQECYGVGRHESWCDKGK